MTAPAVKNLNVEIEQGKDLMVHLYAQDDESHKITFEITKQPTHGSFALDPATGHLQYHSHPMFLGHDLISYIAIDEHDNESAQANVFIDVKPLNSPKVVEICIEVPVNPSLHDIVEAVEDLTLELYELLSPSTETEDENDSGV